MATRRGRPKYDQTIPEGWTLHDGSGNPLPKEAVPAVMFRYGVQTNPGTWAWEWGRLWTWDAPVPGSHDIVAYLDDGTRKPIPKPPAPGADWRAVAAQHWPGLLQGEG